MFTVHFSMTEAVVLALLTGLVWHVLGLVAKTAALQFNAAVTRKKEEHSAAVRTAFTKCFTVKAASPKLSVKEKEKK